MNAIEINNLTKNYKGFKLDNISLTLPSGCIIGFIGENGAGKSTTIRSILGMVKPDSGEIKIMGKDMDSTLKNDIGVVLDEVGLPSVVNVKDVNRMMKKFYKNWDEKQFFDYIKRFSLPENKKFGEYSKGMKMKLGIAVALSHHARLLILDEPTSGLDPLVRDEIIDILNDFTREDDHSILISSHIVSDLEKICDYIAFIHNGKLMLCEEKDVLLEKFRFINVTKEQLAELDQSAIKGRKVGKFGVEAIAEADNIPACFTSAPVTIEDLFVFMAKEDK